MLMRPPFPCTTHPGLYFVYDEQYAVLPANSQQLPKKEFGRRDVSAFALNRLDNDPCDVLGIEEPLEDLVLQLFKNLRAASLRRVPVRATVGIWIRDVLDAAQKRAKSLALRGLRRC